MATRKLFETILVLNLTIIFTSEKLKMNFTCIANIPSLIKYKRFFYALKLLKCLACKHISLVGLTKLTKQKMKLTNTLWLLVPDYVAMIDIKLVYKINVHIFI